MSLSDYEVVIGLEVHAQLATQTKIFCGCATKFGAPPNSQICPVCSGQPGVLPVLNRQVVDYALRMALACNCQINRESRFARKNYFYPDLPKGYQISQFDQPLAEHGYVEIIVENKPREIKLTRIHLEEDAGKNIHGQGGSLVDLNRAGVPLIEIVSEPDLHSAEEAAEYMRTLRGILRSLGICDGNMEQGSLRCDANISLRRPGTSQLGQKTEIKNVNSFRFVQKALEYEVARQAELLDRSQVIVQETRLYNSERQITESMRSKEEAHDYRYFPEPDLPPLKIDEAWLTSLRQLLVELPVKRRQRFVAELGLSDYDAAELTREKELADYFEAVLSAGAKPKAAANWLLSQLLSLINDSREIASAKVTPTMVAELLALVETGKINGKLAKDIWAKMWATGQGAEQIASAENLFQTSDRGQIEEKVRQILAANPKQVEQYRAGNEKLFGFFVGQVMRAMQGKGNPALVNELLKELLK